MPLDMQSLVSQLRSSGGGQGQGLSQRIGQGLSQFRGGGMNQGWGQGVGQGRPGSGGGDFFPTGQRPMGQLGQMQPMQGQMQRQQPFQPSHAPYQPMQNTTPPMQPMQPMAPMQGQMQPMQNAQSLEQGRAREMGWSSPTMPAQSSMAQPAQPQAQTRQMPTLY